MQSSTTVTADFSKSTRQTWPTDVAETWTRTVARDFTVRFKSCRYQIPKSQARRIKPGDKLTVELSLGGSIRFRCEQRYLELEPVEASAPAPTTRCSPSPLSSLGYALACRSAAGAFDSRGCGGALITFSPVLPWGPLPTFC